VYEDHCDVLSPQPVSKLDAEQNTGFLSELEDRNMNWQGNEAQLAVTESRLEGNYHETWL
jgi:hypothetical protein